VNRSAPQDSKDWEPRSGERERILDVLEAKWFGNTPLDWGIAAATAAAIVAVAMVAKPLLVRRLGNRAEKAGQGRAQLYQALVAALLATQVWLVAALALSVGSEGLALPRGAARVLSSVATVALFGQLGLWLSALLAFWLKGSRERATSDNAGAATSLSALGLLGQLLLWTMILLLVLENLGINVTTLVAGLGIGGVAVALAVQSILGDLFASLSIVIDKPFAIGDFIIIDEYRGTVEHVGMKSTRIRSVDGEQIVLSNSDLLKTRVRNYKRMRERRVVFPFRVAYGTPPEQLEQIPGIARKLIESHENTRVDRSHFYRFGDAGLEFETVFWMKTPDYGAYMDVQQAVNLGLIREFQKRSIALAGSEPAVQTAPPAQDVEVEAPKRRITSR